jgi:hypothetical protein
MDDFVVVGSKSKTVASTSSCWSPSAALVATDKEGKEFETLLSGWQLMTWDL